MTEPTRYAALAAWLLRERPLTKESRLSREVGISVVAHGIAMRRKRRGARLVAAGVGFAAVAALAIFFAAAPRSPGASACRGANCTGTGERDHRRGLDAGQSIVAPAGAPTSVVLASGTQIALDAKSVLECRDASATQRFALLRGGAHLHVAKLRANERFLVDTPHAEVEVRGTVFDVKLEPATSDCSERSLVAVHEGRVEVRAGGKTVTLVGGEQWASACTRPAELPPAQAAAEAGAPLRARLTANVNVNRRGSSSATRTTAAKLPDAPTASTAADSSAASSSLIEQNDLYAAAEAARRAGRSGDALAAYARLLARFPRGQLAESAFVERVRLLSRSDTETARSEAERYLARYPAGFARNEMHTLARSP
jgi:ferric-dicitrate binding protein FerR (iron transport regulator)